MSNSHTLRRVRWRRWISLAAVLVVTGLGVVTLLALEGNEVVSLGTRQPDGSIRTTRVWIATEGESSLIEAAGPERAFLHDLLRDPRVTLTSGAITKSYIAAPLPNPEGHVRIRRLLREKYGWADRWIGHLADTSNSLAIELSPG